ncbi:MAG: hypothetical protein ACU836_15265 [Gammaproteobacteria bacterium]
MQKLTAIVVSLFLLVAFERTAAETLSSGTAIYQELQRNRLLEDYMTNSVGEIAGTVVAASHRWPGILINKPYIPGMINMYLVDSARLTDSNPLKPYGVDLTRNSLDGNALAVEDAQIVIIDSGLLKSLVTAAILRANFNYDTMVAVATIKARGIEAFRQFWDPNLNPALTTAGYAENWVMLASGALAFVIAHEIGHIAVGAQSVGRRPVDTFKGKEDRDKHWACVDLIGKKYQQQQAVEKQADDYGVSLLSQVLFPPGVLTQPLLRYELGAHWFIVYSIGKQMVRALYASESPNIHAALRLNFGPEIYNDLISKKRQEGLGSVNVFFPEDHPAYIRRASESLARLAQSPYSSYQGGSSTDQDVMMFEMFLAMECRNLKAKYGE